MFSKRIFKILLFYSILSIIITFFSHDFNTISLSRLSSRLPTDPLIPQVPVKKRDSEGTYFSFTTGNLFITFGDKNYEMIDFVFRFKQRRTLSSLPEHSVRDTRCVFHD